MKPSPGILITTLVLAVCGAFVIAAPARGNETSTRVGSEPKAPLLGIAPPDTLWRTLANGGCKSVATFTSSAAPELQKDGCVGCHSGSNARAKSALDLTSVGTNDAAACTQALTKVNLANKTQSILIQSPAGARAHLGGKVDDPQIFTAAMLGWINSE